MKRYPGLEIAVFGMGLAIGIACANDTNAQTAERIIRDDTVSVNRLLNIIRGSNPLVCEMTARTVDMHGSWFSRGSIGGDPLIIDSASAALIDWIQRSHNDPALVAPLRAGMHESDACVRRIAASLLSRVRHMTATDALVAALGDPQPGTREVAALGLGMSDSHGAVDLLEKRLADDNAAVRRASAWALGELESKKSLAALIHLLARDPDARVRQTAAWAIGSMR